MHASCEIGGGCACNGSSSTESRSTGTQQQQCCNIIYSVHAAQRKKKMLPDVIIMLLDGYFSKYLMSGQCTYVPVVVYCCSCNLSEFAGSMPGRVVFLLRKSIRWPSASTHGDLADPTDRPGTKSLSIIPSFTPQLVFSFRRNSH